MNKKEIKRFIIKNQMNLMIALISLAAFIIGIFAIGFLKSFLIVGIIDILLFAPNILNFMKKKKGEILMKKKNSSKVAIHSYTDTPKVKEKRTKPKKEKKKKGKLRTFIKWFLIICFILGILACIAAGLFFMQIAKDAQEFDPNRLDRQESTIIYTANGEIITKLGAQKREKITYDQMSENLINAIIATEDSRYFNHNGFDLPRFLKASVSQLLRKDGGGASTITMQVSKNNYTSRTSEGIEGIKRKFTDIYRAMFQLEKKYTKEEILEFYVNDNYMGGGAYGVEQACLTYFGKHAKDLNLAEAAMIAGLFQSPGGYDPFLFPEACESRRQTVLYLMERHGYITSEERAAASKMTVDKLLNATDDDDESSNNEYMGFVNTVVAEVIKDTGYDPYTTPMKIYTTLNTTKQDEINKILKGETYTWKNPAVDMGVAMIDTQTGAILAVSTGRHNMYSAKVLNYATIKHQIGSTAKPLFDYGPAIEYLNWSTGTLIVDEEHGYSSGGTVNNWDLKYMGMMTIQDALRMSRNIPAIKTFQSLDMQNIKTFTSNLHLSPELENGIIHEAHSIGGYAGESPVDLAAAYNAFANGGYYITPHSYTKIEYRDTGEVVEKKVEKIRAMSEETAYMVMSMLMATPSYALGPFASIPGVTYGAKTGTTNFPDSAFKQYGLPTGAVNDFWVVGSSPDYTISLWYGYDSVKKENIQAGYVNKVGDYQHEKLFQLLGTALFEKGTTFTKPTNVVEIKIEKDSYPLALPSANTPEDLIITALFKKGTEPTEVSPRFDTLSNVTNLKAMASGNEVTLSWTGITPPKTSTEEGLRSIYQPLFQKTNYLDSYIASRVNYNNAYVGNIEYQIYKKNSNGTLTLMDHTTNNQITFKDNSGGKNTYIVKTSYSIFKAAMSSGTEVSINVEGGNNNSGTDDPNDGEDNPVDFSIVTIGNSPFKISESNPFDETGLKYIMVTEKVNGVNMDITKQTNIKISHETFDYSQSGTKYTVKFTVTYNGTSKSKDISFVIE